MFDLPVDYTATMPDAVSLQTVSQGKITALSPIEQYSRATGTASVGSVEFIRRVVDGTLTFEEFRGKGKATVERIVETESAADQFRNRIALLVRQYSGAKSKENEVRLAMLTERIRRLDPSVSESQVEVLTEIVEHTEEVSDKLAAIRGRFNLKT